MGNFLRHFPFAFVTIIGLSACGGSGKSADLEVVINAVNSTTSSTSSLTSGMTSPWNYSSIVPLLLTQTNNLHVESIVSGPPDSMTVYLKKITARLGTSAGTEIWASPNTGGTAIALTSGNTDLSALGLSGLKLSQGKYDELVLEFGRVALIKGCVIGTWDASISASTGTLSEEAHGSNVYASEAITAGTYTFCTREDKSQLDAETFSTTAIGSNSDYRATSATSGTEIDLKGQNKEKKSIQDIRSETLTLYSSIDLNIQESTKSAKVTLAVDLNRMLRFFANTRTDRGTPAPGMKAGTSYFFTTLFSSSITAFAGDVGSIEGYQLTASRSGQTDVPAWLTLFKDSNGSVIAANVMPDDDNTLTIYKGRVGTIAGNASSGWDLNMDTSDSTLKSFVTKSRVGDSGTCSLEIGTRNEAPGQPGTTWSVAYTRRL